MMKKLLFFVVLAVTFLLPSLANACQGTVYALDSTDANSIRNQAQSNCNVGDSFVLTNLSTGKSVRIRIVNE